MPQLGLHQQIGGGAGKFWNADFTSFRLTFNLHNLYYVKSPTQIHPQNQGGLALHKTCICGAAIPC